MNGRPPYTEDEVQGFADRRLTGEAARRMLGALEADPSLADRVQDCRMVNDVLRHAFGEVEPPPRRRTRGRRTGSPRRAAAAAALFLPAGFLAGWLMHSLHADRPAANLLAGGVTLPAQGREHLSTVFHIDVSDRALVSQMLDRAEAVLTAYAGQDMQVEVVANASGLDLLRADNPAFAARVRRMMDEYDNLAFVACANSIRRLREQGVDVRLVERTHTRATAIDHVVERLRQGWTYIKI
jgi:intracellular sulfur oxidation DsrE/DsrF family protein